MTGLREYHRALALHCLSSATAPMTAGDLTELMGTLAMSERPAHPPACWRGLNAQVVIGVLRTLEKNKQVERVGMLRNSDRGRDEPTWRSATDVEYPLPDPPPNMGAGHGVVPEASAPAVRDASQWDGLSREDMFTLLDFYDEQTGAIARFLRDVSDINDRYRQRITALRERL